MIKTELEKHLCGKDQTFLYLSKVHYYFILSRFWLFFFLPRICDKWYLNAQTLASKGKAGNVFHFDKDRGGNCKVDEIKL